MSDLFPIRFPDQLRQHLRALRKRRGLTQTELGKLVGVTQARIAEIEANPGAVRIEQMMQLLSVLGGTFLLQEEVHIDYPVSPHENKEAKAQKKGRDATRRPSQSTGDLQSRPTANLPSLDWRINSLRQGSGYGSFTTVLVSPPAEGHSKSASTSTRQLSSPSKVLKALNPDKDVAPTSRRNFVLRPKKGSW